MYNANSKTFVIIVSIFCQVKSLTGATDQIEINSFLREIDLFHSSLLSVFGLSATSTYDSYLPLIFGIFGMIWGHFWNVRKGRFWGHGGRRGQTTSKSKMTKILNENLLKLDEIQNLTSATLIWPLDLKDLGRGSVNFFKNYIFKISASSWKKINYSSAI